MKSISKPIFVEAFSTEKTTIKVSFPEQTIVLKLQDELKKRFMKKGFKLSESENDSIMIKGEFVMINEGNRFLRWLLGLFGVGSTKLQIAGIIKENGQELNSFNYSRKGKMGFLGGQGKNLLMSNACGISIDIVKLFK